MTLGALTGHKLSGIRMRLTDGAHHIVDSSEYAFNLAAQGAVNDGLYGFYMKYHMYTYIYILYKS